MYTVFITRSRTERGYFKISISKEPPQQELGFDMVEVMHGDDPEKLKQRALDFLQEFDG